MNVLAQEGPQTMTQTMTPEQEQILNDLTADFEAKLTRAIEHYISMCQAADIPPHHSQEVATHLFLVAASGPGLMLPQEVFAQTAFNAWASAKSHYTKLKQKGIL